MSSVGYRDVVRLNAGKVEFNHLYNENFHMLTCPDVELHVQLLLWIIAEKTNKKRSEIHDESASLGDLVY